MEIGKMYLITFPEEMIREPEGKGCSMEWMIWILTENAEAQMKKHFRQQERVCPFF